MQAWEAVLPTAQDAAALRALRAAHFAQTPQQLRDRFCIAVTDALCCRGSDSGGSGRSNDDDHHHDTAHDDDGTRQPMSQGNHCDNDSSRHQREGGRNGGDEGGEEDEDDHADSLTFSQVEQAMLAYERTHAAPHKGQAASQRRSRHPRAAGTSRTPASASSPTPTPPSTATATVAGTVTTLRVLPAAQQHSAASPSRTRTPSNATLHAEHQRTPVRSSSSSSSPAAVSAAFRPPTSLASQPGCMPTADATTRFCIQYLNAMWSSST
ncbi:hypothetical protein PTSG_12307 [Salpingoeca rosetta]|uniref:Uncharacterized protein n=1 Tax=Salpingoeca rosetta (strain ATCC 50818 / BSB-021) TaxID=946362 RepID=F2UAA0_SALR5|nr:uncharacterized protein PTSG_12307 [Salpingoeca rosetta]EGD73675.1 hypothetical protein PTSG_12307 [Salpingoeca rosetta]|eukprot:XP_004993956.1 hypothetical protein PTSG_12307 [Salpingoeca rosetta]